MNYYEEMVKEAYEDILDSFEKEAANAFFNQTREKGYGSGATSSFGIGASRHPENLIAQRALINQLGLYHGLGEYNRHIAPKVTDAVNASATYNAIPNAVTGRAAKKAWRNALDTVANPPGRTLEDIQRSAAERIKANRAAAAERIKAERAAAASLQAQQAALQAQRAAEKAQVAKRGKALLKKLGLK